jgi:nitrite reductase (cytochrome c-552)
MRKNALILAGAVLATFLVAYVLTDVIEKRSEAGNPFFRVVELTDTTENPATWGKNFPLQYDSYLRTVDMVRTRFGGSDAVLQDPTPDDPRRVTSQSKLEHLPALKRMWAGYAFAIDFREERGHAYMLEDQLFTDRQQVPQPGTCLNCHASMVVPWLKAGDGDLLKGFEALNPLPYDEARRDVRHPISCIDCHDPESMQLRVTRPAFMEGIRAVKAAQGVADYDVNRDATHLEMRTFVCGQCHVEYYFKGDEKRLVYPWANGLEIDSIYAYYGAAGFKDWTHAETGSDMLKAQHPEFETWSMGTHSKAGVACADCHMPYRRVGAQKISDHHVRSPLLDVAASCQTCHRDAEETLLARAEGIQARHATLRDRALDALVDLIDEIKAATEAGVDEARLAEAREFQRRASFYVDFVEAENSTGFHADQEGARILAESIDYARRGQLALRDGVR